MLASTPTEQLRRLYDPLDSIVWLTDDDGAAIFVNRAWTVFTGLSEAASLGHGFLAAFHEEDREAVLPGIRGARAAGTFTREYRLKTAGGGRRWVEARARRLIGEDGAPYWLGSCTDVHDRKLAETRAEALAALSERLSRVSTRGDVHAALHQGLKDAGAGGVILYEGEGGEVRAALWDHCPNAAPIAPPGAAPSDSPLMDVVRGGAARFFGPELRAHAHLAPQLPPLARSFALLPLRGGDGAGALLLSFEGEQVFDEAERRFLNAVADLCGLALARAREREGREQDRALLSSLLDAAPAAICFFDQNLRYVRVNAETERLNGHPAEAHQGRTLEEMAPQVGTALRAMLEEALERDEPITGVPLTQPLSGGGFRHWLASFYPVRDAAGRRVGAGSLALDISEEVRAGEALREADARFRLLAERARDLISRHAPDGSYLYASPSFERVLGVSPESLVGRSVFDFSELEDRPALREAHARLLAGESAPLLIHRVRRGGGELRWLESSVHALYGEDGALLEFQVASRDVTRRVLAEHALTDERARLRALIENLEEGVIAVLPGGEAALLNPAALRLHGLEGGDLEAGLRDLPGRNLASLTPQFEHFTPEGAKLAPRDWPLPRALRGEKLRDLELRLRRKDDASPAGTGAGTATGTATGTAERWVSYTGGLVRAAGGEPLMALLTARDVTERREAERELREREERYRTLVEGAGVGIARLTPEGRWFEVNPAMTRLLGYAREELLGANFRDITHPGDLGEEAMRPFHRLVNGEIDLYTQEKRYLRKDGGVLWASVTVAAVRDEAGRHLSQISVLEDITARKQAEAQLARSREQLDLAFQAGQLGLWDWDVPGGVETWSARQAELFGLDVSGLNGEAVTLPVADFYARVHPNDRARVRAGVEAALAGGDECRDEYRVILPSGRERWIRSVGRVYRDADGRAARMTGVNDDITERKTAQARMERLNADLEARVEERTARLGELHAELVAFAASVSRDIQEPLRRIAGFTGLLERRLRGRVDARTAEYLHFIQSDGDRVARLVEDLSQFAAYGQRELRLADVPLSELAAQVRSDVEGFARGRAVEWTLGKLPSVRGDAMLLRQALAALLHNALKFTRGRDPARIEVSATERAHEVEVCVRDNGVGFPAAEAARLFGVFVRLHGDRYDGAGVGLANVRRIVNRHGGRVWAEGEEGVGAAFFFTLPKTPDDT